MNLFHALFCLVTPALARAAEARFKPAKTVGTVVLAYAAGILFGNAPGVQVDTNFGQQLAGGAVLLAVPLLLFTADVRAWLKLARPLLVSFALACVASVTAASGVALAFRHLTDEWWKVAGMLVGVFVGGTANMTAVGLALETRQETFVVLNTADVVCGGAYLFFLLSVAQRLLSRWLPPFSPFLLDATKEAASPWKLPRPVQAVLAALLSAALVAAGVGASFLTLGTLHPGVVMLVITTGGIAASFSLRVRTLHGSDALGDYLLLIFCVAMGSLADARQVGSASLVLLSFVALVLVLTATLHFALCRVAGIDVDTAIISSTATIFGPPFIAPVAAALNNRTLVGPGLTLGLMGIALGTYLGLLTSWALRALM